MAGEASAVVQVLGEGGDVLGEAVLIEGAPVRAGGVTLQLLTVQPAENVKAEKAPGKQHGKDPGGRTNR